MHNIHRTARVPDHVTVASSSTEIWPFEIRVIPRSLNSRDSFLKSKFENLSPTGCRLRPVLSWLAVSFELHDKMAQDIDLKSAVFGTVEVPWPRPWPWRWIGSRSHQHAQYVSDYQHAWQCDCSLTQYWNMAIWLSWNIDILWSLNSRDSFPRR